MPRNIEIKSRYPDPEMARGKCHELGAEQIRDNRQIDVYFRTNHGRLKLRKVEDAASSLIFYDRSDSPTLRASDFEIIELPDAGGMLERIMSNALGVVMTVDKRRTTFRYRSVIINIDELAGLGCFVEIESEIDETVGVKEAFEIGEQVKHALGVHPAQIVSCSYAELIAMKRSSDSWRGKYRDADNPGQIFLLDGASCSGKTTLTHRLLEHTDLDLHFIPRYCTRKPRTASTESEYLFVGRAEFDALASQGEFIEWRDFEFDMSYGLPWTQAFEPVLGGHDAIGVMDLGNIEHVKAMLPEAVTILVDAPVDTIRKRLLSRGYNVEEQIEERLGNARTVQSYRECYDYVVSNDEGLLEVAEQRMANIIKNHRHTRNCL